METDDSSSCFSTVESEILDIDVVLLFLAVLTKMKVRYINVLKLIKYLYKCKEEGKYEKLLNNIDIDSDLNSRCLNECYCFLNLCKIIVIEDGKLFINDRNLNYKDVINDYSEYVKSCEDLVYEYFKLNPSEFNKIEFCDYSLLNKCFEVNDNFIKKKKKNNKK